LLGTLKHLRDIGNTLIVVEHDEDTMRAADFIVDVGPGAGSRGGEIVATGTCTWHLPLIFGTESLPETKDLPENSSMQKAYKKLMLAGKSPEGALGYRYYNE
ncbi:MAG: hypothetical protein IJW38_05800, partial [Clostridia bacterium]|nr:hypothetical protein [Clostridia bacterium]